MGGKAGEGAGRGYEGGGMRLTLASTRDAHRVCGVELSCGERGVSRRVVPLSVKANRGK